MEEWEKQQGIAFYLIYFTKRQAYYYLRFEDALTFWNRAKSGGRKSFRIEELNPEFFFLTKRNLLVPYLDMLQLDLEKRDAEVQGE